MNALYDVPAITSAFFVPPTIHSMIGARVIYRPMETRRSLTAEGVILDISVHLRGIVWVFVEPLNETMTPRWYIASDVIVSYVWGTPEPCARCRGCSVIVENGMRFPCDVCCTIDEMS